MLKATWKWINVWLCPFGVRVHPRVVAFFGYCYSRFFNPPSVSYRSSLERKYYGRPLRCLSFLSAARLVKSYVIDRKLRIIDILHDWPFVATAILQKANSKELSSLWFSCDRSNERLNLTLSLYVDSFVWHYVVGFSWSLLLDASDFSFEQR